MHEDLYEMDVSANLIPSSASKLRRELIAKLTRPAIASNSPTRYSQCTSGSTPSRSNLQFSSGVGLDRAGSSSNEARPASISSKTVSSEESVDPVSPDHLDSDRGLQGQICKHLPKNISLANEGADITRDLVKLSKDPPHPRRSRSWSDTFHDGQERRGSFASELNVPGGFRRDFLINQTDGDHTNLRQGTILTKTFVEFLSIYGHFAGEDLETEDDIACHYKLIKPIVLDENIALLGDQMLSGYVNPNGTATDKKAYFLLLKAFVGTGVLFLPKAFSNGGLVFSTVVLLVFGLLSFWCYLILVYVKIATRVSSFGEIGLKLYGQWLQRLILSSIVISQIGFVAAYIVFTSENLRAFVGTLTGQDPELLNIEWFTIGQVLILIPMSFVRDITKLSLLAVLANAFIFVGLVVILYYIFYEWLISNHGALGPGIEYLFNKADFSLFIGVAIFAFEGIGLILPIQESMIYPSHFPKVLGSVIATISTIFVTMGVLGYITFGDAINTVIILNLPQKLPMIIIIQLLYLLAILLSTPLQLFPAIRLIESRIFSKGTGKVSARVKWSKNAFRFIFVIFVAIVAYFGGHNLDRFISFVGCFACIPLVYMYPPLLHLKGCCGIDQTLTTLERRKRIWLGRLDYALTVIGAFVMAYTTYQILFE